MEEESSELCRTLRSSDIGVELHGLGNSALPIENDKVQKMWEQSCAEFHRKFDFRYLRSGEGIL